jgi:hypothetical protein
MPSSLNGTGVTFNDGTQLNSANDAGGNYIMRTFTSPGTWTKPAGLKAVKVTVVGAGGSGGTFNPGFGAGGGGGGGGAAIKHIPAPSIPGPVAVTQGTAPSRTSSFGSFVSATGGSNGSASPPNQPGAQGAGGVGSGGDLNLSGGGVSGGVWTGVNVIGREAAMGFSALAFGVGQNGVLYGGGGAAAASASPATVGAAGIVVVEEFY